MNIHNFAAAIVVLGLAVSIAPNITYGCDSCGVPSCGTSVVTQTVMRPQYVTETRMVAATAYRYENRQRTITVQKCVAETSAQTRDVTVMVPEQRTRTVSYTVQKPITRTVSRQFNVQVPVWSTVEQNYTVQIPHTETRQANRTQCRRVPVTVMRTVCRDAGCWVNQTVQVPCCDPCGGCCTRTVCRRVYVPKTITEQVPVTAYKTEWVNVPYQYNVTVYKPETRTRNVRVCNYRTETRTQDYQVCEMQCVPMTREVTYTCYVPKTQQQTYNVTNYRMIPEQRVQTYRVCVPYQVQRPVQVRVCRMVPTTVQVPVCNGCGACCG